MEVRSTKVWRSNDGYSTIKPIESYNLIYDKNLLLLNKSDIIGFTISVIPLVNWTIYIRFISNPKIKQRTCDLKTEDNITNIHLNDWYADDWIENDEPLVIESTDKTKSIFIKIRSNASKIGKFRSVAITIWQKA